MADWALDEVTTRSLAALALQLGNNPKTRTRALELIKEVRPNARFPELETRGEIDKVREELAEEKTAREREKMEAKLDRQKRKLTRARGDGGYGLKTEEVAEVEKYMEAHSLVDYDVAARAFMFERETGNPSPASFEEQTHMQLPGDKGLLLNPDTWARESAHSAITEIMKRNRAA